MGCVNFFVSYRFWDQKNMTSPVTCGRLESSCTSCKWLLLHKWTLSRHTIELWLYIFCIQFCFTAGNFRDHLHPYQIGLAECAYRIWTLKTYSIMRHNLENTRMIFYWVSFIKQWWKMYMRILNDKRFYQITFSFYIRSWQHLLQTLWLSPVLFSKRAADVTWYEKSHPFWKICISIAGMGSRLWSWFVSTPFLIFLSLSIIYIYVIKEMKGSHSLFNLLTNSLFKFSLNVNFLSTVIYESM